MTRLPDDERMLQLLADRATEGLDEEMHREISQYAANTPDFDADGLDLAAAAAMLALMPGAAASAAPPPDLMARLRGAADQFLASNGPSSAPRTIAFISGQRAESSQTGVADAAPRQTFAWLPIAACLLLAAVGWWKALGPRPETSPPSLAAFVEQVPDVRRVAFKGAEPAYAKVTGEVLWSDSRQTGFMKLRDLPPNDPSESQYQLWIVDPDRDEKPVDGGVFDVTAAGEVIIPIDAKLAVRQPAAFAITREKPGGVVVSAGPLLVVASAQ